MREISRRKVRKRDIISIRGAAIPKGANLTKKTE